MYVGKRIFDAAQVSKVMPYDCHNLRVAVRAPLPPAASSLWTPTVRDVRRATQRSGNSVPGPDGIPAAAAHRALRGLAEGVLHRALLCLMPPVGNELRARRDPEFNAALMFFIPKKEAGADAAHCTFYDPQNVRPRDQLRREDSVTGCSVAGGAPL